MQYSSEYGTRLISEAYQSMYVDCNKMTSTDKGTITENDWKDTMPDKNPYGFSFGVMPYFIKSEDGGYTPYHLTSMKIVENDTETVESKLEDFVTSVTNALAERMSAAVCNIWDGKTDNGLIVLDDEEVRIADMFKYYIAVTLDSNPDGSGEDDDLQYVVFGINSQDEDGKVIGIIKTVADRCDGMRDFIDGYSKSKDGK